MVLILGEQQEKPQVQTCSLILVNASWTSMALKPYMLLMMLMHVWYSPCLRATMAYRFTLHACRAT